MSVSSCNILLEELGFSVIIPTMYKVSTFKNLLDILENEPLVKEVIIIENAPQNFEHQEELINYFLYKKVKLLPQQENIFVNPSWNLGAKHANEEYLVFCNDDIIFDPIIFKDIFHYFTTYSEIGCIGMHNSQYDISNKPEIIGIKKIYDLPSGWGCLIFCKKENYIHIPEDLKIYYGDNYLVDNSVFPSYAYLGSKVYRYNNSFSQTCNSIPSINEFSINEKIIYNTKYKNKNS